jgi:hypothetical protein
MRVLVCVNTTSIMLIHFCYYHYFQVARREVKNNGARVVIADDTDVFVLLLHFKNIGSLGSGPIFFLFKFFIHMCPFTIISQTPGRGLNFTI